MPEAEHRTDDLKQHGKVVGESHTEGRPGKEAEFAGEDWVDEAVFATVGEVVVVAVIVAVAVAVGKAVESEKADAEPENEPVDTGAWVVVVAAPLDRVHVTAPVLAFERGVAQQGTVAVVD